MYGFSFAFSRSSSVQRAMLLGGAGFVPRIGRQPAGVRTWTSPLNLCVRKDTGRPDKAPESCRHTVGHTVAAVPTTKRSNAAAMATRFINRNVGRNDRRGKGAE
jgi:hypothetical protein